MPLAWDLWEENQKDEDNIDGETISEKRKVSIWAIGDIEASEGEQKGLVQNVQWKNHWGVQEHLLFYKQWRIC